LPVTVLSRCLQFNLKKLQPGLIEQQLAKVCKEEGVDAESSALRAIARAADGSMRDALSLLDQGIAFGGGKIETTQIKAMLGTIDRGHVLRLVQALAESDGAAALAEVDALDELAPDYGAALDDLAATFQQIAVLQLVKGRLSDADSDEIAPFAEKLTPEEVQLYYQIALHGRRDLAVSRDDRMSFEMTLLRMLAFQLDEGTEPELATTVAVPRSQRRGAPDGAAAGAAQPATVSPASVPGAQRSAAPARSPAGAEIGDWQTLIRAAGVTGAMRSLADHCELQSAADTRVELVIAKDKTNFNTDNVRGRLQSVLSEYLGREIRLTISIGDPPRATPAERRRDSESERLRVAREAIEQDPNIKAVQTAFDAVLEPDSIQPVQQGRGNL
jgi:DNA polymerase-3 subunit gamma/tau